jgi:polyhydroxybutyrate depolymerase
VHRLTVPVLAAALLVAGCSDDSGQSAASTTTAPPTTTSAAAECRGTATVIASGDGELAGRHFLVDVPESYDDTRPVALILDFHGFGSSAQQQVTYSQLAPATDAIVVSPDALGEPARWSVVPGPSNPDIAFAVDLVAAMEDQFCIDPDRVHATGISLGSALTSEIACAEPDVFASVAMVAATIPPLLCDGATRMPVLAFHGTADRVVPYDGGLVASIGAVDGVSVPPAEEAMAAWADQNGCPDPVIEVVGSDVSWLHWEGCDADVELYRVEGAGHVWPGALSTPDLESRLGPNTDTLDASALIAEWFESHPRV